MNTEYVFKRSFYYDAEDSAKNNSITFILGARKCGKTVCMKQLAVNLPNAKYYDIKSMDEDDAIDLRDEIVACIEANESKIFLIDEATYFIFPEKTIARIANEFTDCRNTNTRVVFAGSQSIALEAWANRAFAGNAKFVYADFLSYPEWLAYKGIDEVSEKTYNQFVLGTREFYQDFVSLDQYLKGCLEETVTSNFKTSNIILNNNCDRLNEKILKKRRILKILPMFIWSCAVMTAAR
ncbi:MAG: AAA family ATPase [Butyrivibrio sp.]|nr:AAA family ATPase [Muribaculum sp.]MCM1552472.1 AAA family ATPase [Butyrivibrio sp.]